MQNIKKYFMTLALLLTAVTGAWAQTAFGVKEITADMLPTSWSTDESAVTADDLAKFGFMEVTEAEAQAWTGAPQQGNVRLIYTPCKSVNWVNGEGGYSTSSYTRKIFYSCLDGQRIFITTELTEWPLTPDADKKVWTLAKMPANDIELQVEYFAESNLFLGKEALADKGNIAVKNGETAVDFDADGKSANTVTEGNTVTVTYTGSKKVIGVKAEKGGGEPVLLTTITAADNSSFKSGSQTFGDVATVTLTGDWLTNDGSHGGWYCTGSNLTATISVAEANGANITSVKFYTAGGGSAEDKEAPFEVTTTSMSSSDITTYLNGNAIGSYGVSKIEVYGTK